MEVKELFGANVIVLRVVTLWNAFSPIEVTDAGISIEVILVPINALLSIFVAFLGSLTDVRLEQLLNKAAAT